MCSTCGKFDLCHSANPLIQLVGKITVIRSCTEQIPRLFRRRIEVGEVAYLHVDPLKRGCNGSRQLLKHLKALFEKIEHESIL